MTRLIGLFIALICLHVNLYSQVEGFGLETVYEVKSTSVKNQENTGTCWAYSTTSFIESEIIRMGGPALDLSEMYFVHHTYNNKALQYILLHGKGNFSQGGQAHDVINVLKTEGFVQNNDYSGKLIDSVPHNHDELEMVMKSMLDKYINQVDAKPSELWFKNISSVLKNYLGELPKTTGFNKRSYSPVDFAKGFGIASENYIELSSYSHHPFYELFDLEVPDNWSHDRYYNLPIDELINVMQNSLAKGYSIVWDGDVSENYFSHKEGLAILPEDESLGFVPQKEIEVSQEDRQKAFYSWQATDDHLMHIVGLVKDVNGSFYFKVKNSWGTNRNNIGGYLYMSMPYARLNTVAIMIHKDALEKTVQKELLKK